MTAVIRIAAIALAALFISWRPAAAAVVREHVVVAILHDGTPDRAAGLRVEVTPPLARGAGLAVGDAIPDGTRIRVPARVTVRIAARGDTVELAPGTDFRVIATGSGVAASLAAGRASFTVTPHVLDFFRVTFRQFTASVRGTVFGVDGSNRSVTFSVSRGIVNVSRTRRLVIESAGKEVDGVHDVDVISASGTRSVSYPLSTEAYLARYKTFADAERYYRAKLAAGERAHDAELIDAALDALTDLYDQLGNYATALGTAEERLRRARAQDRGAGAESVAAAYQRLAQVQVDRSDLAAAWAAAHQAEARWKRLDPAEQRAGNGWALTTIAAVADVLGQYDAGRNANLRALAIFRHVAGPDGEAGAMVATEALAVEAEFAGDFAAEGRCLRAALADVDRLHAGETPRAARLEQIVARNFLELGIGGEAEDHARRSIAVFRRVLGTENSPDVATGYDVLAYALLLEGHPDRALQAELHATALLRASGHAQDAAAIQVDVGLGFVLQRAGRMDAGQRAYEEAFAIGSRMAAGTNAVVNRALLSGLMIGSERAGKPAAALAYAQRELAVAQGLSPPSAWYVAAAYSDRALAEGLLNEADSAVADDQAAVRTLLPRPNTPILLAQAYARLAAAELQAGARSDARADAERARSIVRAVPGIWPGTIDRIDQQTASALGPPPSPPSPPP